jgi:hypothetical protein
MKKSKRGQVTIFIIVAVVIVSLVALFFAISGSKIPLISGGTKEINPDNFFKTCIEDEVKSTIMKVSLQGGYLNNSLNRSFTFEGEDEYDIAYLCYNQNYYVQCINQEPLLIQHLKQEVKNDISDNVENCFNELTTNIEKEGYSLEKSYNGFEVQLSPGKIELDVSGKIAGTKNEQTVSYENFKMIIPSKFYDLSVISQEIVSQEAEYCGFNDLGYNILHSEFKVTKFRTGDSTVIYTIENKDSKEKFRFAIRSCVIPPGI